MDVNSRIQQEENEKITFHDKLSLLFVVIGAIFLTTIVVSLALNMLNFDSVEFEVPFG